MIDAKDFLNVTRDIIEQQIRDRSTDAVCEIESINEDGTLNVFVLPDKQTILKNIINESRYNFRRGDNALLYKIHNRLSDSFVVAKFRPRQEDAGISEKSVQSLIDNALQNYQGGSGGDSGGIQGPPGPQGIQGEVGPTGPKGDTGEPGLTTKVTVNGTTYTQSDGNISLPDYAKIGTTATNQVLSKIEYLAEVEIPTTPDETYEYAITDLIGYGDLDANLQERIDHNYTKIGTTGASEILSNITYLTESSIPASPTANTEYAITDLISYEDLDASLQERIDHMGNTGPTGPAGTVPHFYRHEIENMSTGTIDGIRFYLDMTTQNPTEQQILDAIPNGLVGQFLEIGTGWLPCSIYYNSKTNKISFCSPSYQNIDDEPSLFNFGVKKTTQLF